MSKQCGLSSQKNHNRILADGLYFFTPDKEQIQYEIYLIMRSNWTSRYRI